MLNLQESSGVLFIAGFGPIVSDYQESHHFYVQFLKLPLKPLEEGNQYLTCEQDSLEGTKHFALVSCFNKGQWPADIPRPQSWIEFEASDIEKITQICLKHDYKLLVNNQVEPWGRVVTPWLRE